MLPARIGYEHVLLRRLDAADADRVAALCSDWEVAGTTALIPHPYTRELALEWIAGQERPSSGATEHVYAVTVRENGLLVGAIGLRDPRAGSADNLGYWIGRAFWGRGYASAAASAAIALAFTQLDVDVVTASHLARNPASGRVMEKCGMQFQREELRPHRGGPAELFRVWTIDLTRWQTWTGLYLE